MASAPPADAPAPSVFGSAASACLAPCQWRPPPAGGGSPCNGSCPGDNAQQKFLCRWQQRPPESPPPPHRTEQSAFPNSSAFRLQRRQWHTACGNPVWWQHTRCQFPDGTTVPRHCHRLCLPHGVLPNPPLWSGFGSQRHTDANVLPNTGPARFLPP